MHDWSVRKEIGLAKFSTFRFADFNAYLSDSAEPHPSVQN